MTDGYVELHGRSAFSFLEGASMPEAMTQQAANLGMPALGILDRDGLYSAPRLYMTAKKLGLRSHIGAEISTGEFGSQVLPETWQPHAIPERPASTAPRTVAVNGATVMAIPRPKTLTAGRTWVRKSA